MIDLGPTEVIVLGVASILVLILMWLGFRLRRRKRSPAPPNEAPAEATPSIPLEVMASVLFKMVDLVFEDAEHRDQELRERVAEASSEHSRLRERMERAQREAAEARALAREALLRASEAPDDEAWTKKAQGIGLRMQAAESDLASVQRQYDWLSARLEEATGAVEQNGRQLQDLAARRMQLAALVEKTTGGPPNVLPEPTPESSGLPTLTVPAPPPEAPPRDAVHEPDEGEAEDPASTEPPRYAW
ncbi:MAG TPA: hypothetical protein VMM81_08280 [Acidimicrobiia bacterium]|nr:hypothetical protein [Acidimicrobiia bacterium]